MKTMDIAKAIVDSYEENGIGASGKSFYDLMYMLYGTEAWDMVIKAMREIVIEKIKENA
jgi:hypothetical protein